MNFNLNGGMTNIVSWIKQGLAKGTTSGETYDLPDSIPRHIAIIMDGNGRWAQSRGFPRFRGHQVGRDITTEIVRTCGEIGVEYLTLYTFSTENWGRPKEEVELLMALLSETIDREVPELAKNNVRLNFLGRLEQLPVPLQKKMAQAEAKLSTNTALP